MSTRTIAALLMTAMLATGCGRSPERCLDDMEAGVRKLTAASESRDCEGCVEGFEQYCEANIELLRHAPMIRADPERLRRVLGRVLAMTMEMERHRAAISALKECDENPSYRERVLVALERVRIAQAVSDSR